MNKKTATLPLTLMTISLLLLSCMKNNDMAQDDLGPGIEQAKVEDEIYGPSAKLDLTKIYKGEWVGRARLQRVTTSPAWSLAEQIIKEVIDRKETTDQIELTVVRTNIKKIDGKDEKYVTQEPSLYINKSSNQFMQTLEEKSSEMIREYSLRHPNFQIENSDNVQMRDNTNSFHRLSVKKVYRDAPDQVKALSNCGGVKDCKLNVNVIDFDQVVTTTKGDQKRFHFKFEVSPDAPYMAYFQTQCLTLLYNNGTVGVPIEECTPALVFAFGTKPTE